MQHCLALITYKEIKGDLLVPSRFVPSDNDAWPEQLRGMKLGITVDGINRSR
jgi:hypothetical protein